MDVSLIVSIIHYPQRIFSCLSTSTIQYWLTIQIDRRTDKALHLSTHPLILLGMFNLSKLKSTSPTSSVAAYRSTINMTNLYKING